MPREKSPTTGTTRKRAARKTVLQAVQSAVESMSPASQPAPFVGPEQRAALIAEAAYFRAEQRGFASGQETEDWLAAEAEVDARLLATGSAARV